MDGYLKANLSKANLKRDLGPEAHGVPVGPPVVPRRTLERTVDVQSQRVCWGFFLAFRWRAAGEIAIQTSGPWRLLEARSATTARAQRSQLLTRHLRSGARAAAWLQTPCRHPSSIRSAIAHQGSC